MTFTGEAASRRFLQRRLRGQKLIDGFAVPATEGTDALHIATAAYHGMDVLLTWNCKHMANPYTLPKTRRIIEAAGFKCPNVTTPERFMEDQEDE